MGVADAHLLRRCLRRMRMSRPAMRHISSSAMDMSAMPIPRTLSRPALDDRFKSGRSARTYRVHSCPDLLV